MGQTPLVRGAPNRFRERERGREGRKEEKGRTKEDERRKSGRRARRKLAEKSCARQDGKSHRLCVFVSVRCESRVTVAGREGNCAKEERRKEKKTPRWKRKSEELDSGIYSGAEAQISEI